LHISTQGLDTFGYLADAAFSELRTANERRTFLPRFSAATIDAALAAISQTPAPVGTVWLREVFTGLLQSGNDPPFASTGAARVRRRFQVPGVGKLWAWGDDPYSKQLAAAAYLKSLAPTPQLVLVSSVQSGTGYNYISPTIAHGLPGWATTAIEGEYLRVRDEPLTSRAVCDQFDLTICQIWAAPTSTASRTHVTLSDNAAADFARKTMRLTAWALTWRYPAHTSVTDERRRYVLRVQLRRIAKYIRRGYVIATP